MQLTQIIISNDETRHWRKVVSVKRINTARIAQKKRKSTHKTYRSGLNAVQVHAVLRHGSGVACGGRDDTHKTTPSHRSCWTEVWTLARDAEVLLLGRQREEPLAVRREVLELQVMELGEARRPEQLAVRRHRRTGPPRDLDVARGLGAKVLRRRKRRAAVLQGLQHLVGESVCRSGGAAVGAGDGRTEGDQGDGTGAALRSAAGRETPRASPV